MNAKDGKNMPMNYNEESSLNFSHMLKNINANVGSKFDSPVETGKSGFANQHPSMEKSHKLPDFTSSHIMEADNQSSGFRSIRSSSSDDEPDDLFWLEYCPVETIKEALSLFRLDLKFPQNYWTDKLNESYYKNSNNTDGNDDMYDKLYIEADEVDSPGTYKIVGHPNLLQKLNKPGRPLEEEIDLEELGIIELEEEDELIDDVEHEPEISKKFGKNRPVSSGRSKLSQTIKVRPNSPQGRNNNEQIIQEYLAQNLMNAKDMYNNGGYQEEYNDVHIEDHHLQGAANPLEKVALRPHNPVYRPLTPPVRNLTPSNAMRGDQQQQHYGEGNINQTATSKIAKAFHQSTEQFGDNRRGGSKLLKASPSAINLNIDGDNSQPSSGGPSAKTSVMYYENLDEGYPYTNFEQEPGQLEGDVIYLNPRNDGFNSPKQIIKKHGHGHGHGHSQEMFIGDRSDDVFSFKGRSSEKTQHLSFGGSNDDFSNREIMKEQKSRYKAEMGDYHSSGGHSEEGLSARTNSPVDVNDQEDQLEPVEDKKGQIEVDVSSDNLKNKLMKNPIKSPLEGGNKISAAAENKSLRASKDQKNDVERMSAEQADTINLVRRNLGTIEAQNEAGKKLSDEYINVHDDSVESSEENPEQVHLLSQKYGSHEVGPSYLHNNQYFDDYEDLSSTNQQMMTLKNLTSHYQKPGPYTAPLNNNYLIKDHYDEGSQDKLLQPKSEGNSLASLQVNQFNTINQKELSAAIKSKKKAPASRFSDYGQVSNVLKENKRSSSNPKAGHSQQKKLSERRKNPLGHASVHNYSQNASQNSGQEKSSPTRKDNMMKNILKKAVHILKHDQRDSHPLADRHEKSIKKSSLYANESMDASSTNDVYGILPKEREKSQDNKRSVSAEKGNVKYFNLPMTAPKNPLDVSGRLSQHKQATSKLERKTPKMSSQSGSHKKGSKGEWIKDERVFFPKRVTPLKNNRGSQGFAGEVLEDISNQTM